MGGGGTSTGTSPPLPATTDLHTQDQNPILRHAATMKRKMEQDVTVQEVVHAPYAKYGVTSRQLKCPKAGDRSCIVLSRGWPSWFWAAKCRGYDVKLLMLGDDTWKAVI